MYIFVCPKEFISNVKRILQCCFLVRGVCSWPAWHQGDSEEQKE